MHNLHNNHALIRIHLFTHSEMGTVATFSIRKTKKKETGTMFQLYIASVV